MDGTFWPLCGAAREITTGLPGLASRNGRVLRARRQQSHEVAVGVILAEGAEPSALERWHSAEADVRFDQDVCGAALDFMAARHVKTVVMGPGIIGCPHEEGVDYAVGEKCPACSYWADRDRWTGEVIR